MKITENKFLQVISVKNFLTAALQEPKLQKAVITDL